MAKPIHSRKGNSLWARSDNFVIARAHAFFCKIVIKPLALLDKILKS
jgi:hypothetical protein